MAEDNSTENASGKGKGTRAEKSGGNGGAQKQNPGPSIPSNPKSCKGCLFYSVLRHSKSKSPACFGITGTYDKLSPHILRAADLAASKRGASHKDFIYSCLGRSIYFDDKSSPADSQNKTPKMPSCFGIEFIGYSPAPTTESKGRESATTQPRGHEQTTPQPQGRERGTPQPRGHEHATPQPQGNPKPKHSAGEEFFNRFRRNMGIVALGVAKNLKRVGNYAKETLDDILNSNRREPK